VVGANGAGKTNLLESLHLATQGFSPRTRADTQLIRFGADRSRVALAGQHGGSPVEVEVTLKSGEAKRARLNGAALRAAEELRTRLPALVFTPDRLSIVKAGPAVRRAYFDRALGRLFPSRASAPIDYAAALAQRNGALRRVAAGFSTTEALDPWTTRVAELGRVLVGARAELVRLLSPALGAAAAEFRLESAELRYEGDPASVDELAARLEQDLSRGFTGIGPHLHDVAVMAGDRDLRSFGSQGEQRLAVLSLLLAESDLLAERGPAPPLLLLDDVLSELDPERRAILAGRVRRTGGQALLTATSAAALPDTPDLLVAVTPGLAVAA
jgi:DNA replication and repair protein RecF